MSPQFSKKNRARELRRSRKKLSVIQNVKEPSTCLVIAETTNDISVGTG
jgi:hypothetical protein